MTLRLICNKNSPPFGGLAVVELIKGDVPVEVSWADETAVVYPNGEKLCCFSNNDVLRALARVAPKHELYGQSDPIIHTMVDQWLTFSLTCDRNPEESFAYLNKCLAPITYLVSNQLTIADLAVFHRVYKNYDNMGKNPSGIPNHVQRWYNLIIAMPCVKAVLQSVPDKILLTPTDAKPLANTKFGDRKQEGKFIDLPGAEMGKVIVRFPPEASGYLHIGHAKAALLNQYYQEAFQGKLIMRFDDTNPAKENVHFEKMILKDLELLEIKPDLFTHTSNYFDLMIEYCERMIKEGKAYVDDTEPEQMKAEREKMVASANRTNSVERNFVMWREMLKGSESGKKCCVRAKIDMTSPNGCMRDPTIYRCKNEPHPRTGTKYKVYPTYDFACPIVDAIENVTHTLRTMEYHDRDDQFYWFIEALELRKPFIWEYSRLNMTNTVLSKRKLTWFVDQGLVEGWDDPRFPTVRGIIRRGMTVEGLKQFIIAQGSSKSVVFMEWDKIWAFNKKVIDPIAPRYTALEIQNHVLVKVAGAQQENLIVPRHPKNKDVGNKIVTVASEVLVDYVDAETLKEGENATFINWGNIMINKIERDNNHRITCIYAKLNLENKDFKKTVKLTWLARLPIQEYTPTTCVYFDHIIEKPVLSKDEDFKQHITKDSKITVPMLGDPELKKCKVGDIIQLQRRGFFKVDIPYSPRSKLTSVESPIILLAIPDGHAKESPTAGAPKKSTVVNGSSTPSTTTKKVIGNEAVLSEKINDQGNKVRKLKEAKAEKPAIDKEVKELLDLKAQFKELTGTDWKPDSGTSKVTKPDSISINSATDLNDKIVEQGQKVRDLKASKAVKSEIDEHIKLLLKLKADYKTTTGSDWKPCANPVSIAEATPEKGKLPTKMSTNIGDLHQKIIEQGNNVRNLKAKKATKSDIDTAVKILLELKSKFKAASNTDWTPEYKILVGEDFPTTKRQSKPSNEAKPDKKVVKKVDVKTSGGEGSTKKQTRLGLEAKKEENLSDWYSQVITKGEMIEYYDVSGCYILRHWSFAIWKAIKTWFDDEITRMGVKECYFPIFVSRAALEKEKTHIADFAPEVAWVTKSGDSDLSEPIAVRPTSETVMYPAYAKWIQSYRDLPIRLNQWNNVVRWEFKHPQPFLRTREFLWQEGHTAFATQKEATDEVYEILDLYAKVYTDLLAIPVVKGRKTEKEKFAGGDFTTTVEAFISASGRAIQGATSHHLGQNFSKMFDIVFEDPLTQQKKYVYQNSWGITTRTIGVMIMVHADNQGLVLPPNVAATQVVIVPCGITASLSDNDKGILLKSCTELTKSLSDVGVRTEFDNRDNYSPGWKFNHWELKGVPIRIELGPKDIAAGQVVAVRRDNGDRLVIPLIDVVKTIQDLLQTIHESMFAKANNDLKSHLKVTKSWNDFVKLLDEKNIIMAPFCGQISCEDQIKNDSQREDAEAEAGAPSMGAKSLCIPFEQPATIDTKDTCINPSCTMKPQYYTLFGRSY